MIFHSPCPLQSAVFDEAVISRLCADLGEKWSNAGRLCTFMPMNSLVGESITDGMYLDFIKENDNIFTSVGAVGGQRKKFEENVDFIRNIEDRLKNLEIEMNTIKESNKNLIARLQVGEQR